jgi:hypothetical protein
MWKKVICVLALVIWPFLACNLGLLEASPFLVSDPNASAVGGYSDITGGVWVPNPTNVQANGSVKVDMAAAPVGTTVLQVRVCKDDPVWGPQCSPFVPFSLTRPGAPSAPANTGLIK